MSGQPIPILTVTLNPALDLSAHVDAMVAGPKLRLDRPHVEPGGGGVNVARAIHELGGAVAVWVALGGTAGAQHRDLMEGQGLPVHGFEVAGETRANWAISDATGAQFRLQLPGPEWNEAEGEAALADIANRADGIVVLSGSQPPGLGAEFPQNLAATLGNGCRLVVDTSGDALRKLVEHPRAESPPFLPRLDQAESEALAGAPLGPVADSAALARALLARGVATWICLARGAEGSVLVGQEGAWHCRPPEVEVASKVGAGDSFTGAFVLALAQNAPPQEALRQGTAAAAAAVMTEGTALCRSTDVARLAPDCASRQLDA